MKIVFLGTGGAGAPPGRAQNSILVEGRDLRLLLDAGPSSGQRLREYGLSVCSIGYIILSHLHLDHWAGLFDLAVQAAARGCRPPPIVVEKKLVDDFQDKILPLLPKPYRLEDNIVVPVESRRSYDFDEFILELFPTSHTITSFATGIRTRKGKKLVYTSDTRLHEELLEFCSDAKLIITEATLPSDLRDIAKEAGHQTVSDVLRYLDCMKKEAYLAIVHLTEESLNELSRVSLPANIIVPNDLTVVTL